MRVWLLTSAKRYKCYENARIREEMNKLGVRFRLLVPDKFEIVISRDTEKNLFYNQKPVKYPDVLMPRYTLNYFSSAVIREFEKSGKTLVLNKSDARELAKDKLASIQALSSHNIPVPKTLLAKFPLDIDFVERNLEYPILVKKTHGSEGKGIVLCRRGGELEDIFELMESSIDAKTNLILQEFIEKSYGKDIRVLVVGGRAIGAMLRKGIEGSYKSNYSRGGNVEPIKLTPDIESLAVESAKILGLDIAGVDILFDEDGYRVCEVNNSPYFEGFEKATKMNIPREIYKYITLRLQKEAENGS